ncbi:MDR family MFS transporter [Paenibacillus dendrobii]|uniref:MDR family MFS transporter n=1 Tax=Paenibacillus dendrobii TaxID=2691084 RepID=UPI00311A9A51
MAKSNTGLILTGLLISLFVAALDQTVVSTAMGTIVADLGGIDKYVWVSSAYFIAELAGMPIYGKLSDMFGRKRFFVFGVFIFLLGSVLCGLVHNMVELSIYRAIQGIGGGVVEPIVFTIAYSIIPDEKRGRIGGLFGSAFGLASILGPLLGSYLTEMLGWRWIFYLNLIPGLISLGLVVFFYRETHTRSNQKIDWLGTFTLVGSLVCLSFALEMGGSEYEWTSPVIVTLFFMFVLLFCTFLYAEKKVPEPIISFRMFKNRLLSTCLLLAFIYGAAYIVVIVYMPLFVQGVMGRPAINSGFILIPLLLSSILTSMTGSTLIRKIGYRVTMLISGCVYACGIFLLIRMTEDTTPLLSALYMIVIGIGVGFSFSVLSIGTNRSVDGAERGAANSILTFLRAFGMTVGITVFGIIQKNLLTNQISKLLSDNEDAKGHLQNLNPEALLTPGGRSQIPDDLLRSMSGAFAYSLTHMFMWLFVPAALILVFALRMNKEKQVANSRPYGQTD